eukprot:3147649-Rhodomonas_salina.1
MLPVTVARSPCPFGPACLAICRYPTYPKLDGISGFDQKPATPPPPPMQQNIDWQLDQLLKAIRCARPLPFSHTAAVNCAKPDADIAFRATRRAILRRNREQGRPKRVSQ